MGRFSKGEVTVCFNKLDISNEVNKKLAENMVIYNWIKEKIGNDKFYINYVDFDYWSHEINIYFNSESEGNAIWQMDMLISWLIDNYREDIEEISGDIMVEADSVYMDDEAINEFESEYCKLPAK